MKCLHLTLRVLICLWLVCLVPTAQAARLTDLYEAEVPVEDGMTRGLPAVFDAALRQVLVKITGRRDVMADPVVMSQFVPADKFVQQYRTDSAGTVRVLFDQIALRSALDGIAQPVWGEERPVTLVWLVTDYGIGRRDILPAESDFEPAADQFGMSLTGKSEYETAVRDMLQATASERGLPLIFPLVDSEELATVSISDVWGGFTESLLHTSQRYGVDAVLVGRARMFSVEEVEVRWILLLGDEQFEWEGTIASGPDQLAGFFAARLATSSSGSGQMQLRVDGINSLNDYGRLSRYLSTLDVIENYSVDQISGPTVVFSVLVRGDADRLMRSIALRRILQPVDDSRGLVSPDGLSVSPFGSVASSLHYALLAGP